MSIIELGIQILKDRQENSLSQEQLCKDICSQPTLSLLERGHIMPSLDIISKIALKLKRPLHFYLQYLIEDNISQTTKVTVKTIDQLLEQQQYGQILRVSKDEIDRLNRTSQQRTWYEQYLLWTEIIASYRMNKVNFNDALITLKGLIHNKYYLLNQNKYLYSRIMNSIALIYGEKNDLKSALFYYDRALQNGDFLYEEGANSGLYVLRIYYNKAKTLYDLKCYEESLVTVNEGINKARELEIMSLLGNFYYYMGLCYEALGHCERDIKESYRKAAFFFKLLDKDKYLSILHTNKKRYIKDPNN